jgi:hypothetical protein
MRPDEILSLYSFNSLRSMERARGYGLGNLRRAELIAALSGRLFDAPDIAAMLAALAPNERAALATIAKAGGRLPRDRYVDVLIEAGLIDEVGPDRPRETIDRIPPTTRRFLELCARLTARGLLFSEPHVDGTLAGLYDLGPGAVVFVPGPVERGLTAIDAPAAAAPAPPAAPAPIVRGRVIIQPSYSVLQLPPVDEPTLKQLQAVAEQVRIAEVAEFKLTQAALYHAVQRGATVAGTIAFLEQRSEQPLPQNVRYSLESWGRAFERTRVLQGAAIVEGQPAVLDELVALPAIATLVVRRLGPERLLLVDAAAAAKALTAAGELPGVTDYARGLGAPLAVTADGRITPDARANHLLAPLALGRVAERLDDGTFQLTPRSVRAAVASTPDGLTGLLKWLRGVSAPLPPELVARLKLWAVPQSDVALEQPLLLRLPPELLAELRAFPEIAPLLAAEYRRDAALIAIAPEARDALVAALRSRGLDLAGEER